MSRISIKRTIAAVLIAGTSTMLLTPAVGAVDASRAPHAILHAIL